MPARKASESRIEISWTMMPNFGRIVWKTFLTWRYDSAGSTTSSPASSSEMKVVKCAAMPEANSSEFCPPHSSLTRPSTSSQVGLL